MNEHILNLISLWSGRSAIAAGTTTVVLHPIMEWFGKNAVAIGAMATALTCIVFVASTSVNTYLKFRNRNK